MKKIIFILLSILILLSVNAYATTYYVRTDGNNSNNGLANTSGGAWLTIDYAADNVAAEDIVRVQAGTYAETVTPSKAGTSGSTITFVADGTVKVTGWTLSTDYLRIIGFDVDNDGTANGCILISGARTGIELWNNTLEDALVEGVRLASGASLTNSIIFGNVSKNHRSVGSGTGFSLINYSHLLFAYNEMTNIDPDGVHDQGSYGRFLNNYVHDQLENGVGHPDFFQNGNNTVDWTFNVYESNYQKGAGTPNDHFSNYQNIYTKAYENNIFRRNLMYNLGSGSFGFPGPGPTSNFYYYHNTTADIHLAGNAAYATNMYNGEYTNINDLNNINVNAWGGTESGIGFCYSTNSSCPSNSNNANIDGNLAYKAGATLAFHSTWSNQAHEQSNADPDFTNYDGDDFTLGDSSNATNNGIALTLVNEANGTGTDVDLDDTGFFVGDDTALDQYSGALVVGDTVTIGTDAVVITAITDNNITFTPEITWADDDPVYLGTDATPDIGAYPYKSGGYSLSATYVESEGTVTVTPNDADLVRMVVVYEDGIPVAADSISPYSISGVGNGSLDVRVYPLFASATLSESATASAPTITGFVIPSTSTSLTVPITTWTATDDTAVTGYCLVETNSSAGCSWAESAQTSYVFSTAGSKTLYAFAKNAMDSISSSSSDSVEITLAPAITYSAGGLPVTYSAGGLTITP